MAGSESGPKSDLGHPSNVGGNYPDVGRVSDFGESLAKLSSLLTDTMKNRPELHDGVSITSDQTNKFYNENVSPVVRQLVHQLFVNGSGWWTIFARPNKSPINSTHVFETWPNYTLDPAPQDVAPRFITRKKEAVVQKLERYNLGATFRMEELQYEGAPAVYSRSIAQLVSASYTQSKMLVAAAAYNGKNFWRHHLRQNKGVSYHSLLEASQEERDLFCVLNKTHLGLYNVNNYVSRIAGTEGKTFSNLVVPAGTLDMIAGNTYETTANKIGETPAMQTLTNGGRALVNRISNLTIFEDPSWNIQNAPPELIQQLVRRRFIGQWFKIGTSETFDSAESFETEKLLSAAVPEGEINKWVVLGPKQLSRWDMKFNLDNGELSNRHDVMLRELGPLLQRMALSDEDSMVDPFVWKSDAKPIDDDTSPDNYGYQKTELFGEMDPRYWSIAHNIAIGTRFKKNLMRDRIITQSELDAMKRLDDIAKILNDPQDILDDNFQAYLQSFSLNPENITITGSGPRGLFLDADENGAVKPPYVDHNVPGANVKGPAMYVYDSDQSTKLYVWIIRTVALAGSIVGTGTPAGYALLPMNDAGEPVIPDDHPLAEKESTADVQGLAEPQLAVAPSRPYGFGLITGLRTLANLYGSMNDRGWSKFPGTGDLLREIAEGVTAVDTLFEKYYDVFIMNPMFDATYIPEFMKSNNDRINGINLAIQSMYFQIMYPIMLRIPSGSDARGRYVSIVGGLTASNTGGFSDSDVVKILREMGFNITDAAGTVTSSTRPNGYTLSRDATTEAGRVLNEILRSKVVDAGVLEELKTNSGRDMFNYYADPANNLGSTYEKELKGKLVQSGHAYTKGTSNFAAFYLYNVMLATNIDQGARVFHGILSLVKSRRPIAQLNQDYIDTLKQYALPQETSKGKRKSALIEETADATIKTNSGWINSRLALSGNVWNRLYKKLTGSVTVPLLVKVSRMVVRPSDRKDPTRALGGRILEDDRTARDRNTYTRTGDADSIVNETRQLAYAGEPDRRPFLGVFEHLGLVGGRNTRRRVPGGVYGGIDSHTVDASEAFGFSEYADADNANAALRIPSTMYRNPVISPFVKAVDYRNTLGITVKDATRVVTKKWLVARFHEIEQSLSGDKIARIAAQLISMCRVNMFVLHRLIDEGLPTPINTWIVAQPYIRFLTGDGIWFTPGPDTAELGYNFGNIVMELDGMHMKWLVHLAIWLGCAIFDPSNYMIITDLMFKGLIGGYNFVPFLNPGEFSPDSSYLSNTKESIFVFNCGGNIKDEDIPEPLALSSRINESSVNYNLVNRASIFGNQGPQLVSGIYYNTVWGFDKHYRSNINDISTYKKEKAQGLVNELMYSGSKKTYSMVTKEFSQLHLGQGHVSQVLPPDMSTVFRGSTLAHPGPLIKSV
jgi:hypothetical protein